MQKLTAAVIAEAIGGKVIAGDPETLIEQLIIDSRQAAPGTLFVPIVGEKVDAHKFIPQVFAAGAAATFTSNGEIVEPEKVHIKVEDTKRALGLLATWYRKQFTIPVIGITGSVGKTSTKEMISAALSETMHVMKTAGNQNSQIGVPLTLLRLMPDQDIAVVEMGISEFGEMDNLADYVTPDVAAVTNIGEAHIANFGKKENTRSEKLKIAKHFTEDNRIFLNGDDPLLLEAAKEMKCPVTTYGMGEACDFRAVNMRIADGKNCFTCVWPGGEEEVALLQLGDHSIRNALVAMAVAEHFGIAPSLSKKGVERYEGIAMRQQISHLKNGIKLIDDTYNASPASIVSGIQVLMQMDNPGKKIAVLGDVLELGEVSEQLHYETGVAAANLGVDTVITVGCEMRALARGVKDTRPDMTVLSFDNNQDASAALTELLGEGDAVFVKGSRGMHMEEVVAAVKAYLE